MGDPSDESTPRRWLREPLVHFLALGALLFGADALLRDRAVAPNDGPVTREVVVDRPIRAEVRDRLATRLGHDPSDTELEEAIEGWIRTEVLYREGLARHLDDHDPTVRDRVASRMGRVLRESAVVPEPTEQELREHFNSAPERWAERTRIDFTQVFVAGEGADAQTRATELLAQLRAGANPAGLGDTFSGGRRYRRRSIEDLEAAFGSEFVEGIADQAVDEWVPRRSRAGVHLVRVDGRSAAQAPAFERVRDDVAREWRLAQEEAELASAMAELMESWTIVRQ